MLSTRCKLLVYDYLLNICVWHQVTCKHLMGLAGEGRESEGFLRRQTVTQHSQLCTEKEKHRLSVAVILLFPKLPLRF